MAQARKRLHTLRLLTALIALLVLPFVVSLQKVSAAPMNHMGGDMHESCAAACAQLSSNAQQQAVLGSEENPTPDPTPRLLERHFVQFLQVYEPKVLRPAQTLGANAIRPPDIVALTSNYQL